MTVNVDFGSLQDVLSYLCCATGEMPSCVFESVQKLAGPAGLHVTATPVQEDCDAFYDDPLVMPDCKLRADDYPLFEQLMPVNV